MVQKVHLIKCMVITTFVMNVNRFLMYAMMKEIRIVFGENHYPHSIRCSWMRLSIVTVFESNDYIFDEWELIVSERIKERTKKLSK